MSTRRLLPVAGAILVVAGALWLWPRGGRHRPVETAAAPAGAPDRPSLVQRDYPSLPAAPAPLPAEPTQPTPATPVQPPAPAQTIIAADDRPAPSPQLASGWAIDYRDAVCACHTRSCVRDVQGTFIRRLGAMVQGDDEDGRKYSDATRAAIKCYYALPEGS